MTIPAPTYSFRPFSVDDLPMIRCWLAEPHVAEWWHDPAEQFEFVSSDLGHPDMAQFVVVQDARPFAYLQCYNLGAWNGGFGQHPAGTRGLDQFIGESDLIGQGHGSAFIRAFTDQLLAAGTPRIVLDPDPSNARAIRAYEKAGFHKERVIETPNGPALLMVRNP